MAIGGLPQSGRSRVSQPIGSDLSPRIVASDDDPVLSSFRACSRQSHISYDQTRAALAQCPASDYVLPGCSLCGSDRAKTKNRNRTGNRIMQSAAVRAPSVSPDPGQVSNRRLTRTLAPAVDCVTAADRLSLARLELHDRIEVWVNEGGAGGEEDQ